MTTETLNIHYPGIGELIINGSRNLGNGTTVHDTKDETVIERWVIDNDGNRSHFRRVITAGQYYIGDMLDGATTEDGVGVDAIHRREEPTGSA